MHTIRACIPKFVSIIKIIMKFRFFIVFLLTLPIPFNAIGQQSAKESVEKTQSNWLMALNESKNVDSFYNAQSGILLNDESSVGIKSLNKALQNLKHKVGKFTDYRSIEEFKLRENQKFVLGTYKTQNGDILNTIIGWRYRDKWTKAFEVIYNKTKDFTLGIDSVNKKREDWEKFSNQHRPDLIVSKVFLEKGKYFNRGTQYVGKEIINAYSYMSHESYKIKLDALKVLQVNKDIIFDIGTFTSGGKGLYTLIWKKTADVWKLLIDFNF